MPTYEYQCVKCQKHIEAFQRITDRPLVHCTKCNADSLKRLISGGNFQLQGSGWASDGYGKGAAK
jgi:putative FmdB family regulatory protein